MTKQQIIQNFNPSQPGLADKSIFGFFMSVYWRKSGNLIAPRFTHAFIDSVRNAVLK